MGAAYWYMQVKSTASISMKKEKTKRKIEKDKSIVQGQARFELISATVFPGNGARNACWYLLMHTE
jgi:hypothetical protein